MSVLPRVTLVAQNDCADGEWQVINFPTFASAAQWLADQTSDLGGQLANQADAEFDGITTETKP